MTVDELRRSGAVLYLDECAPPPPTCAGCGGANDRTYWEPRFCSETCARSSGRLSATAGALLDSTADLAVTDLERDQGTQRACSQCGQHFDPHSPTHRFCGVRCRDLAAGLDPDRERPPFDRWCVDCGEHFQPRRRSARLCSEACRQRFHRKRHTLRDRGEFELHVLSGCCVYCGDEASGFDHIVPLIAGGADDWTNLAPCCGRCNSSKTDRKLLAFLLARA